MKLYALKTMQCKPNDLSLRRNGLVKFKNAFILLSVALPIQSSLGYIGTPALINCISAFKYMFQCGSHSPFIFINSICRKKVGSLKITTATVSALQLLTFYKDTQYQMNMQHLTIQSPKYEKNHMQNDHDELGSFDFAFHSPDALYRQDI